MFALDEMLLGGCKYLMEKNVFVGNNSELYREIVFSFHQFMSVLIMY